MADDDDPTRDGSPSVTGYKISPSITPVPREARYRRGEELARGGLGRLTEAYDQKLQRQVAIKELHHRTEQGRRRFELESLTTARLQHPAIVSVFDSGTWDSGEPFIVLQLLEGTTLAEEIAARPTLDVRLARIPNLLAIADALGYAHEQGVVHRDVKPSNIMLGKHGETVILDWGVAYDRARPVSADEDAVVGTPRFMSPEQARGEPPVPAFDVFSLGATIASVLAGRQPFADLAPDDIIERLRGGATDIPRLPPEVPSDLASIVEKATAAETRYAHAGELANDLRLFIAGQLVSSRRYSTRELFVRWVRRNRVLVTAAAAVIVIGVIAVSSVIHERNTAIGERERALERAHELVLLEARSRIRTDPTSTIAWLEEYPQTAPHQDELLALVDEAAGRMVATHVWYPSSAIANAEFADDGALVVATRDGRIVRIDATGTRHELAKLPTVPMFVRARGGRVAVLDELGGVWRVDGPARREMTVDPSKQLTGVFFAPDGGLKVTFFNGDAVWAGEPNTTYPDLIVDDETDSRALFGVTTTGELYAGNPIPRKQWQFTPRTWVRSSNDGSHYLAIAPQPDDSVSLWTGTPDTAPVEIATSRACAAGEDLVQDADVTNEGRIIGVRRCGVLAVYDTVARRAIAIADPDRVTHFELSPDGRWLAAGHGNGFDLVELATGASHRLDPGSTIVTLGFSHDSRSLFSASAEQGVRVWSVQADVAMTGRLAEVAAPMSLALTGDRQLAIRRHLDCAIWSTTERRVLANASITLAEARDPDDDALLWPSDASDDGGTCLFAGRDSTSIVVGLDGAKHTITAPADACVLSSDGRVVWCARGETLFSAAVADGGVVSSRSAAGKVLGLVRFRGTPLALVRHPTSCALETFAGETVTTLRGVDDCKKPQAIGDIGIMVARPHRTSIWTDLGVFELSSEIERTVVSRVGDRAAVLQEERIEIWDLRTHARIPGPPAHARAIAHAAWSRSGILASSDDETIQLWDSVTRRTRAIFAPHVESLVWSDDSSTLYTSDGRILQAWPIDLARDTSAADVRARLETLTTARIIDGRAATP